MLYINTKTNRRVKLISQDENGKYVIELEDDSTKVVSASTFKRWYKKDIAQLELPMDSVSDDTSDTSALVTEETATSILDVLAQIIAAEAIESLNYTHNVKSGSISYNKKRTAICWKRKGAVRVYVTPETARELQTSVIGVNLINIRDNVSKDRFSTSFTVNQADFNTFISSLAEVLLHS
jgi:hypothetical protein